MEFHFETLRDQEALRAVVLVIGVLVLMVNGFIMYGYRSRDHHRPSWKRRGIYIALLLFGFIYGIHRIPTTFREWRQCRRDHSLKPSHHQKS